MINFAPIFYRNLFNTNELIEKIECYNVTLFDGLEYFESASYLKNKYIPDWISQSDLYSNCDGTGTDQYKNVSVYKSISETLERFAFYQTAEIDSKKYFFDVNPTTTGMAAYPHFLTKYARTNARQEAIERWAIHEFNRNHLPEKSHALNYLNLIAHELIVPFSDVKVCILCLHENDFYTFAFAAGATIEKAIDRAKIELNRNRTVIKKAKEKGLSEFRDSVDKTLFFFASEEGNQKFQELVQKAPKTIKNENPKILCDLEMIGPWSEYTKVWRYLLEDSYFDCSQDHTFFMF